MFDLDKIIKEADEEYRRTVVPLYIKERAQILQAMADRERNNPATIYFEEKSHDKFIRD